MARENDRYHVISRATGWALKREGSAKAVGVFSTKSKATRESERFQNQNYDVIIHNSDGTISAWRRGRK